MFKIKDFIENCSAVAVRIADPCVKVASVSIDSRSLKKQDVFVAIKGPNHDGHDYIEEALKRGAVCIVAECRFYANTKARSLIKRHPGASFLKVEDSLRFIGDAASFHRLKFNIPVVGITGSNGKTTTKDMAAWILAAEMKVLKNEGTQNNHIGVPLTLLKLNGSYDAAVIEMGTNHFGELGYLCAMARPNIAVFTNIAESHLEHLVDLEGVYREKTSMLEYTSTPRVAVVNSDNAYLKRLIGKGAGPNLTLSYGITGKSDYRASGIKLCKGRLVFRVNSSRNFDMVNAGRHNIYNALCAISTARILGIGYNTCIRRLGSFRLPAGRMNRRDIGGVSFIDDSYNSNPYSLSQALDFLGGIKTAGRKIFVMGDMMELGEFKDDFHADAGRQVARVCDVFIGVGRLSGITARIASGAMKGRVFTCGCAASAARLLFDRVSPRKGDVVLIKGSRSMRMEEVLKNKQ